MAQAFLPMDPNTMLVAFCDPPGSEPIVYALRGWAAARDQLEAARRDFFETHPAALEYRGRAARCDALEREAAALQARMPGLRGRWRAAVRTEPAAAVAEIEAELDAAERRAAKVADQLVDAAADRDAAKAAAEVVLLALLHAAGTEFLKTAGAGVPPRHADQVRESAATEFRLMAEIGGHYDQTRARLRRMAGGA